MSRRIPKPDPPNLQPPATYWANYAATPPLPPMPKPCGDCAVACGFYGELIDELKRQPRVVQIRAARSWFCHNARDRACRGAWDEIGVDG